MEFVSNIIKCEFQNTTDLISLTQKYQQLNSLLNQLFEEEFRKMNAQIEDDCK